MIYFGCLFGIVKLVCIGNQACAESVIHGVSNILASGDNSVGLTIIYSEIYNGGRLIIDIDSDMTQNWTLYCNSSDTCIILCRSPSACSNLNGYCFGECFVNCTFSDTMCSTMLQGNVTIISSRSDIDYNYNVTADLNTTQEIVNEINNDDDKKEDNLISLVAYLLQFAVYIFYKFWIFGGMLLNFV